MISTEVLKKYTKYSHRYYHFSKEDCDRIKDTGDQPYGWCELLSNEYGNQTTEDVFEPKVLNALNEGRGILLNKNEKCPNLYLAEHNGEKGILIIGVDNVLWGTDYEKTERALIDQDKLVARSCDKAEMDDQHLKSYPPNHPKPIDPMLKIWVRTGFLLPEHSVGIFIFITDYSIVMEYYDGRVYPEAISKIPNILRNLYDAWEIDFNPIWRKENMLKKASINSVTLN